MNRPSMNNPHADLRTHVRIQQQDEQVKRARTLVRVGEETHQQQVIIRLGNFIADRERSHMARDLRQDLLSTAVAPWHSP